MSGPLTSTFLLVLPLVLLQSQALHAKPLSASRGGLRNLDATGGVVRLQRELRDSLPYEAQMMSYSPAAEIKGRANDLYYQPEAWRGQGLGQALQQLMENDQRRDQQASYLANILRLISEAEAKGQGRTQEDVEEDEEAQDFQGPYPPDYDETEPAVSVAKPQVQWQGALDPQLTQALLNRYKQERLLQAAANRVPEREQDKDQEVLRYLVEKVLSGLTTSNPAGPPGRRAKRDVSEAANGARGGVPLRRSRRSLDSAPAPNSNFEASLLRVKRLGDDEDGATQSHRPAGHAGLQRMKRIDTEVQAAKQRKRRALPYDPSLLAQHILQYLPE
ncbi:proprotein convertase subtilisin/kexin type 1 inhibitor, like [Denticeps clupeoides]|uniref:proprotein convertase subtilisin/kexin type 1 inhibitor, like n=1 Tax=Denticeps clupeoides TaxID=299321 RepID=UPI0010A52430|nr:uncharacterized protein LOC114798819 [Denticeps clupeoides]